MSKTPPARMRRFKSIEAGQFWIRLQVEPTEEIPDVKRYHWMQEVLAVVSEDGRDFAITVTIDFRTLERKKYVLVFDLTDGFEEIDSIYRLERQSRRKFPHA